MSHIKSLSEQPRIKLLNLPRLPADLFEDIKNFALTVPPDESGREWIEQYHNNEIKAVSHVYGRPNTFLEGDLLERANALYRPYFNEDLILGFGNLSNTQKYDKAESPPHCDRMRHVAINYLLQAGGDNVLTVLCNEHRGNTDLSNAINATHDQVTVDYKVRVPEQTWHVYDVQYFHYVENITGSRLLFSFMPVSNPTMDEFCARFDNLIIK